MNKNILFLQIYGGGGVVGGTENYLKNLLKELRKSSIGSNFFLITFNKIRSIFSPYVNSLEDNPMTRFMENWRVLNIQYRFPIIGLMSYFWAIFFMYLTAIKIIKRNKIDLIYSNGGLLTAILAYFLFQRYRVSYVLHFHGLFDFNTLLKTRTFSLKSLLLARITRQALLKAKNIVANSTEVAQDISHALEKKRRVSVVHCFVDTDLFKKIPKSKARNILGLPIESFIFLSANRLDEHKGLDFLLSAIPHVVSKKILFIFIGEGRLKKNVESLSKKYKQVKYIGAVENQKLPLYICAADLVWGPASTHYIGLSLIEALACQTPIMALNTPLPSDNEYDQLVHTSTLPSKVGFLIPKKVSIFKKIIEKLVNNRSILSNKKRACLEFYKREYGATNIDKIVGIIYNIK